MKNNMKNLINALVVLVLLLSVSGRIAHAQEAPPSFQSGPYTFNLGLTAGYRSLTTDAYGANPSEYWAQQRFFEVGNYRGSGIALKSFYLYGEKTGTEGFYDQLFFNIDGLGDPFTTASMRMRSFNEYDLKINFRNAKYLLNRNDSIYTGLHKFDETRHFLDASLDVVASDDVSLNVSYYSTGRTGNITTTVSPFVVGAEEVAGPNRTADGSFGTYARGNFYWMQSPVNDVTNEFSLSGTFNIQKNTSLTLGGGYRMFSQDYLPDPVNDTSLTYYPAKGTVNWAGVFAGFPNSPAKATDNPLKSFVWEENQESKTPFAFIQAVSRPIKDLSITATARFEDTKMDGTIDGNLNGIMPRRTGGGLRNLADTTSGHYENTLKTILGSLSVAGTLTDEISLTGVYRITNTDLHSDGVINKNVGATDTVTSTVYKSLFTGPFDNIVSSKTTEHQIEGFVNFLPMSMLNIRAGVKLAMRSPEYDREVDGVADSVSNTNLSRETQGLTPYFSFWYKPIRELKISGRYSHSNINVYEHGTTTEVDMPVRIKPKTTDKYSIGLDITPIEDLSANLHFNVTDGSSDLLNMIAIVETFNPQLTNKDQAFGGSLRYQFIRSTGITLTGEYRTSDFAIPSSFTRGQFDPTPLYGDSLTISVEQHTKDLFFDASVTSSPIEALRILVGYSMIDSKEGSYITPDTKTGIAPDLIRIGGPYTWNLFHAQVTYDLTKNIGLQVDYQLATQKEHQVDDYPGVVNNYKAGILVGNVIIRL